MTAGWTWGELEALRYRCIVADPPWAFDTWSEKGEDRSPGYATMTLGDIKRLTVADLARSDCLLALWAVDPLLGAAFDVIEAWGFRYVTVGFYWVKTKKGLQLADGDAVPDDASCPPKKGYWTRGNPEVCLFAVRGQPRRLDASIRKLIFAPAPVHSVKPEAAQDRLELLTDGPYCELFARRRRPGWDCWGDEL